MYFFNIWFIFKYHFLYVLIIFNLLSCIGIKHNDAGSSNLTPIDTISVYYRIPDLNYIDSLEAGSNFVSTLNSLTYIRRSYPKDSLYLNIRILYTQNKIFKNRNFLPNGISNLHSSEEDFFWYSYYKFKTDHELANQANSLSAIKKLLGGMSSCFTSYTIPQKNILLELSDFAQYEIEEYELADSLYHLTEDFIDKYKINDTAYQLKVYSGHANIKRHLSEYEFAQHYVFKAFDLMKDPFTNPTFPKLLNDLAIMKMSQGFDAEILPLVDSAYTISINQKDTFQFLRSMFIAGVFYNYSKEYFKADSIYNLILTYPRKHYSYYEIIMRKFQNSIANKDILRSNTLYNQIKSQYVNFAKERKAYFKTIESNYFQLKGQQKNAIKSINEAISISDPLLTLKNDDLGPPTAYISEIRDMTLFYLGLRNKLLTSIYRESHNKLLLRKSIANYLYIDSLFSQNCMFTDDANEFHAMDIMNEVYFEGMKLFYEIHQETGDYKYVEHINTFSERLRAKVFYRNISKKSIASSISDPDIKDLILKESKISQEVAMSKDDTKYASHKALLLKRDSILSILKTKNVNTFNKLYSIEIPKTDKILSWCKKQGYNIIAFNEGQNDEYIITQYTDSIRISYIPTSDSLMYYANLFKNDWTNPTFRSQLKRILNTINNPYSNYIILADGNLNEIPLHMLYAIEDLGNKDFSKNYVFYSYSLIRLLEREINVAELEKINSLASFSIADYGDMELPYSYIESMEIEKKVKTNFVHFRGKNATSTRLTEQLEKSEVIHIATHGRAGKESFNYGGIQLKDRFCSVNDLANLTKKSISNKLILNVCNGTDGQNYMGEGIQNIIKSFSYNSIDLIVGYSGLLNDKNAYLVSSKIINSRFISLNYLNKGLKYFLN